MYNCKSIPKIVSSSRRGQTSIAVEKWDSSMSMPWPFSRSTFSVTHSTRQTGKLVRMKEDHAADEMNSIWTCSYTHTWSKDETRQRNCHVSSGTFCDSASLAMLSPSDSWVSCLGREFPAGLFSQKDTHLFHSPKGWHQEWAWQFLPSAATAKVLSSLD